MIEPFPLIEISGPPRERGRQYGRQTADRIRKGASHYFAQLKELSLDADGAAELVRDYLPGIEAFEPTYIEEMAGIAEGAGVPFEDVACSMRALKSSSSPVPTFVRA
jgi:isopenicillin-N N-acyltransferase like protein